MHVFCFKKKKKNFVSDLQCWNVKIHYVNMNYPIMILNKKQADHFNGPTHCVKIMILIIWNW